jgi:hypothetical protein
MARQVQPGQHVSLGAFHINLQKIDLAHAFARNDTKGVTC